MQSTAQTQLNSDREVELEAMEALDAIRPSSADAVKGATGSNAGGPPEKVERKFLVGEVPKVLGLGEGLAVAQGYLAVEKDGTEVRVRQTGKTTSLLVKTGATQGGIEVEVPITAEQAAALWPLTEGRRMSKVTYHLDVADTPVTLDMYEGQLSWLRIAEAEFKGPTSAEAFSPPPWFKREVTDLAAYRHSNLARE